DSLPARLRRPREGGGDWTASVAGAAPTTGHVVWQSTSGEISLIKPRCPRSNSEDCLAYGTGCGKTRLYTTQVWGLVVPGQRTRDGRCCILSRTFRSTASRTFWDPNRSGPHRAYV